MTNTIYNFHYADNTMDSVHIEIDEANDIVIDHDFTPPDWALLDHHQCRNCPLNAAEIKYCPAAKAIAYLFSDLSVKHSYEAVKIEVITDARNYTSDTTMQRALGSLLGLVFSVSNCPRTLFLKPMGIFHLPLSTEMDTLTRMFSFYILRKFFDYYQKKREMIDLEELIIDNKNLRIVNQDFAGRLRTSSKSDASLNAIILLDLLAQNVDYELYDEFEKLKKVFAKD